MATTRENFPLGDSVCVAPPMPAARLRLSGLALLLSADRSITRTGGLYFSGLYRNSLNNLNLKVV
ncbi:hypothetical protein [Brasilonema octagenarum]|uniref:hypothetical protein n=1 Tax=Brasilonema octagenarum TaxID=417105 RepID=UPI00145F7E61|nr:hypothetical protein [Brasilonema octagenarum]